MSERILVVDDDPDHLRIVADKLTHVGFDVSTADDAEAALSRIRKADPAVVVTDIMLPGMSGLELLEKVRSDLDDVDVVVMTGHEDMDSAITAMKAGAFDYLVKPIALEALESTVRSCLEEQALRAETGATVVEEDGEEGEEPLLVGSDPRMIDIYKTIGVLARNRATVLVRGETGTGKERIARAVHENSAHADAPFIAVNCTALSDTLLESELFGHVKGAFTGAQRSRKGYFQMAGSGTIFLDEIGDTSGDFQTKLLRVLQERTFYPVGSEEPLTTEARVIAATHRPMEELVEAGAFREDLYFRLKVVEIGVPPLRERKDDIPALAEHLLGRIQEDIHQDVRRISEGAMEALRAYHWPGNVRELENALTRAAILARGGVIRADHLSLGSGTPETGAPEDLSLEAAVGRHLRRVLERCDGNRADAARLLEVSGERLEELLESHEIS